MRTLNYQAGPTMIAFLVTIYAAAVLTLFKLKLVNPRPYPIAIVILAGVLMIGGVVVTRTQYAPCPAISLRVNMSCSS
jgi:hypothetical protein